MNNNAIVVGMSPDHTCAIGNLFLQLKDKFSAPIDKIIIFHDGISDSDQSILSSLYPTEFINYQIPNESKKIRDSRVVSHFTKMVFCKFECFRLLNHFKNVMWLDYDMILLDDISDLLSSNHSGITIMPGSLKVRGQLHEPIMDYDMEAEGICGSIFVLNQSIGNYNQMYQFCYDSLNKYADILYLGEQAIFDILIQEFKLTPQTISNRIYSPHPNDVNLDPAAKILHAFGRPKFWNGLEHPIWSHYHQLWLNLGGSDYIETNVNLKWQQKLSLYLRHPKKLFTS
jgi:lipopolysaccharide biosynthesis glycosyltransferase